MSILLIYYTIKADLMEKLVQLLYRCCLYMWIVCDISHQNNKYVHGMGMDWN